MSPAYLLAERGVGDVHARPHDLIHGGAELTQGGGDDLQTAPGLDVGVGIDVAVGPDRSRACDLDAIAGAYGTAKSVRLLVR